MPPAIDVSDVTLDPDFAEQLTVYRRSENVDNYGRSNPISTLITPAPYGVVLPQDDLPLQRGSDQQNLPRLLEVHTPFRLRSASVDPNTGAQYQPDVIVWNGDTFLVNKIYDYSHYGVGFIRAACSAIDSVDDVPV